MKIKWIIPTIIQIFLFYNLTAQTNTQFDKESLTLDNGIIKRVVKFNSSKAGIYSSSFKLNTVADEFILSNAEEFYVEIDGKPFTGLDDWKLISINKVIDENGGNGAIVELELKDPVLRISISYLLYPDLPVIRKKIAFNNTGSKEIRIEALDIERFNFPGSGTGTHCWVMNDFGRQKSLGQFIGEWYDPVIVIHNVRQQKGIVLGNEAPGVMKRTTAFLKPSLLTTGLTHPDQNFGFRKWMKPGETWESPWVFTALYANSNDPYMVLNGPINDYIRKYMGIRLIKTPEIPVFVYNTWMPFRHDINEQLIYELADAAAECGIEKFIIDDGWQSSYGDWGINKEKFPNGLKPVFDYIKSKGMKPGVWISIASAESKSEVFQKHPEWAVRKSDGSPINLHADIDKQYQWESYSMCMTTGWYDYIKGVILNLVKEHGLEYIKGDFAVVTGAYTTDKTRSGCHAENHPMHKDRNESMLEMYRQTWRLFDDLHKEAPELFIDCTFETMGAYQLIDLDMCKHAEGNWLSNFYESAPLGSMRVRQMAWWRTPVIPASALVIGNQMFDDPNFELSLMSLAGSLPIVLGDPRMLSTEQRSRYKSWGNWMRRMQDKHNFMLFRQDLPGFSEPSEGCWDGFQRINSDTRSGGIIGVFRHGSVEVQRTVTINFLDPGAIYDVYPAPSGERISRATGKDLLEKGFVVNLDKLYDGAVFEICKIQ